MNDSRDQNTPVIMVKYCTVESLLELHRASEAVIQLVLGMENIPKIRRLREVVELVTGFYPVHVPAPWAPFKEDPPNGKTEQ